MNIRIIYDLASQPFSVGDVLVYQETALVLREQLGADEIDFVVTYDPERPVVDDPHLAWITKENFHEHLKWLMPVASVNQHLGQVFLKTHDELDSMPDAMSWPGLDIGYLFYECIRIIAMHFLKHGAIPAVKPLPATQEWAQDFLSEYGEVTIQMRRNPHFPARNSDYPAWVEFMSRYPDERFVVVCAPHEVDDALRLPNVTIAADHVGCDTERICALVEASDIHMGVSSGPAQMRLYGRKPFCVFRDTINPARVRALRWVGPQLCYPWTTEQQTILPRAENADRIGLEFDKMREAAFSVAA